MKTKKRFGIIVVNKYTGHLYVVRRISYALWDRLNNVNSTQNISWFGMALAMYPGIEIILEFPKGVKDKYESALDCALRELFEETGIRINKNTLQILAEVQQRFVGGNGKHYSVGYFVIHEDIEPPKETTFIVAVENPTVLSDLFNVLVLTKWEYIRPFFISKNLLAIASVLDSILPQISVKTD